MYDELVKRLRYCADSDNQCSECKYRVGSPDGSKMCLDLLMVDAADAIEELCREYESIAKNLTESVELMRKRKAHAGSYDLLYEEGGYNSNGV